VLFVLWLAVVLFVLRLAVVLFVPDFPFLVGWRRCPKQGHTYMFFSVTPKKTAAVLWIK
jgi:hypothetical protein